MATVYPYISENAQTGQKASLKIHQFVWLPVGQGEVRQVSDYAIDIAGEVNIVVYKGDLRIYLQLLDQDPTAASGPWTDVAGAASPYSTPPVGAARFFRARQ